MNRAIKFLIFIISLFFYTTVFADTQNISSKWNTYVKTDNMTKKLITFCTIESTNVINLDFPYSGEQRGKLTIRKHPRFGHDIIFSVEKGQILCHERCKINITFDNKNIDCKPIDFNFTVPSDYSTNVIFLMDSYASSSKDKVQILYVSMLESFIIGASKKNCKMLIEVPFYQNGNIIFEFDIKNIPKI